MLKGLKEKFGETPAGIGLSSGGNVIEVIASKSGSFTIIMTRKKDGITCFQASGTSWENLEIEDDGDES